MTIGQEIEAIRKKHKFSILYICNAIGVSEADYFKIITGKSRPNTYQLIMFIIATKTPLNSI